MSKTKKTYLIALQTRDGLFGMKDHVELGKEYLILLPIRKIQFYHLERKRMLAREFVEDAERPGELLPVELLDISLYDDWKEG